jgi:hypothetical protein
LTRLSSWEYFDDYIREKMLDYRHFVWRGQASDTWLLEPTIDRLFKKLGKPNDEDLLQIHLIRFKYASRGRRGSNPPVLKSDNEWWALGQHQGLATPLLDWTTSPYVAAYFAFAQEDNGGAKSRAVFGISKTTIEKKSKKIAASWKESGRAPIVEFIEPLSDENPRLVSQGGLFTRSPQGIDLESWVRQNCKGDKFARLFKITIPETDRQICLRSLNRMNINHLSLFPDLYGASRYCNLDLIIDKY